ncbi:MAG: hypothetical protein O3B01_04255 [Planctomycetota bacterium]|nr:hypothetical protein [Planctomycetota bacterium]MDA1137774.1 hypothetical protein [Planctomycetota bacterium]
MNTALADFVDHLTDGFTPELARHFSELPEADPKFQALIDELASKANEGALSKEEAATYERYSDYMDFVALMRLKARSKANLNTDG